MQEILLNEELRLTYPEQFHVMDEEERRQLNFYADGPGACLSDPERHLMVSIGWKKINGLAAMLISEKDIARNMEMQVRTPMQQREYKMQGFVSTEAGGKKAEGFNYAYSVDGKGMAAQSLVAKNKKTIYYLHFYARTETFEEGRPVWEEILRTARWN